MTDNPERTFLIIVRSDAPIAGNLAGTLIGVLRGMAHDGPELAFSTQKADTMGVVMRSNRVAAQIRSALYGALRLKDSDFILVLSLDDDWDAAGNSSGWRHIQRFLPSRIS